jgi:D-alanyl-D-alanine carboxypeptidase
VTGGRASLDALSFMQPGRAFIKPSSELSPCNPNVVRLAGRKADNPTTKGSLMQLSMQITAAMRMRTKALLAGLTAMALMTAADAQQADKAKLDKFFDRLAEKNKAMGSLVAAKDGTLFYSRQIGFARINGDAKEAVSEATRFRIGSITKMFTGAMVLQLVEEGKLKLDDTLDKFFPQVLNAKKITIAHLLSHKSGIHNLTEGPGYLALRAKPKTKDEMIEIIAKFPSVFEPGTKEAYSNSNYVLLGYIMESITGKPYHEILTERVTSRLGLKDTFFGEGQRGSAEHNALSYRWDREWRPEADTPLSIPAGAGAIISTPADLVKFVQSLFAHKLVSKASLERMMQDKFAMQRYELGGEAYYGHGGGIDGFRSLLVYSPKEKLAVAFTSNGTVMPPMDVVSGVVDVCHNRPFNIPSFDAIAVSGEVLDKYVGVYSSPAVPGTLTVKRDGDALFFGPTGRPPRQLEATAQDEFRIELLRIVLKFDPAKKQMIMKRAGQETVFKKAD